MKLVKIRRTIRRPRRDGFTRVETKDEEGCPVRMVAHKGCHLKGNVGGRAQWVWQTNIQIRRAFLVTRLGGG